MLDSDHNEIVIKELEDEEEEYERTGAASAETAGDDVFDFDDVPSFEDISLDDLDGE